MFKNIKIILPVLMLGGCAYAIDSSIDDVRFETPGANNAACNVYIDDVKYTVRPPQTVALHKSKDGMTVDCRAPGNRKKVVHIDPEIETSTAWNAANAGVGVPWDYASGAMFDYPGVVTIDFTGIPITDPEPPAQNAPDIRQPEEYTLEEFLPGSPRLNSDKNAAPVEILRRDGSGSMNSTQTYQDGSVFSESPSIGGGKGSLQDFDPSGVPTPLIPGE